MSIEQAIEVLKIEAEGILALTERIGPEFDEAVELIYRTRGRLAVTGIGKSGAIAKKIVSTLNSTGSRAFFLHPVEAMHGDLGQVASNDVLLALSNSGETEELNLLLPMIRKLGCRIIAFTGKPDSALAGQSHIVIDTGVTREACPLGLAPTASTTAQLVMGDALAVVLMHKRRFKSDDFRQNHPGGTLGKRLACRVAELMLSGDRIPVVDEDASMAKVLDVINEKKLGAALVMTENHRLSGIITDGDIRRAVAEKKPIHDLAAKEVMTTGPKSIVAAAPAYSALNLMERFQVTVLPVTDSAGKIQGILHLHDILGKGSFNINGSILS